MKLEELIEENKAQKAKIVTLELQLKQLMKLINGFKSERFVASEVDIHQTTLFDFEDPVIEQEEVKEEVTYSRNKKKHPGRHKLPEHLPVREVIIEPEESTDDMIKIGEEVNETLEYTPLPHESFRVACLNQAQTMKNNQTVNQPFFA